MKFTRLQLQEAIEDGIAAAPDLTDAQKMMLRHVGATADRVARATFNYQGCGCPLTQAGLIVHRGPHPCPSAEVAPFYCAFDWATLPLDKDQLDHQYIIEVTS